MRNAVYLRGGDCFLSVDEQLGLFEAHSFSWFYDEVQLNREERNVNI
jgi:hypothetical protein